MSNHLAFATVTETLRGLLEAAAKKAVGATLGTAKRPDLIKDESPRVNVFLYQVTPNGDWRNADLPTRRADGTLAQRPQAAFNLHYMLSFFGDDAKFEPQLILGSVASLLHSQPVLSQEMVRAASKGDLAASNLAEQVELVRFTPTGLNLEELSKLWSVFFQVPYKLSLAYQASVVFVEPEVSTQPALPVRARNLYVVPFHQPEIDEVVSAAGPGEPITLGDAIVLRGRNLRGDLTRVRIGGAEIEPTAGKVRDDRVEVELKVPPFAAGDLRAGVLGAQVVHLRQMGTPPTPHRGVESNAAPFVLRPKIRRIPDPDVGPDYDVSFSPPAAGGVRTVTVGIRPRAKKEQRVVLLFNELAAAKPKAFSAVSEPRTNDADPVKFKLRGLAAGQQLLVRVQVDGAESPLDVVNDAYAAPKVTVP